MPRKQNNFKHCLKISDLKVQALKQKPMKVLPISSSKPKLASP